MALPFLRLGTKLALSVGALGCGTAGATVAFSDDPQSTAKLLKNVPVRLLRDSITAASIVFDYEYSLLGLPEGSPERSKAKHEVHLRSAIKLRELCFKNGGIYIKLGQHVGQMEYLIPWEYVKTMRESMLNRCPVSSYEQVCELFKKELGATPDEIFDEFEHAPIASASLAQVHVARTRDGQKVAVKVQHAHMTDTAAADHATVEVVVNTLHRYFPAFDYRWLVDELRESLPKELDFRMEAKNSTKCLSNFLKFSPHLCSFVYTPRIHWDLSTSKLLTMEFIDGAHVSDIEAIRKQGIQPSDVAKLVNQIFTEMIFKHGFVHCDPHAANLLVRPLAYSRRNILGHRRPQVVLLDHGLYKELDFATRTNYAALWKALVFADAKGIRENSKKLGAGNDLHTIFAGILTMRPWKRVVDPSVGHLVIRGDEDDVSELQMYASQNFSQITELLRRLPRVILLMLKTNDCLRAVNHSLVQGSSLDMFLVIGKVCSEVVLEAKLAQRRWFVQRIVVYVEGMVSDVRILGMQIALWLIWFRNVLPW